MADRTELDYNQMQAISKQLTNEADAINQLLNQTKSKVDSLHGHQWVGRGADQFFTEMESLVLPSMTRLVNALQQGASAADKIVQTYHAAEDEAQNKFKTIAF